MPVTMSTSEDRLADALRVLPSLSHGHAAVTRYALPYVLPARHLVTGETVLLRVTAGEADSRYLDGTVLAYRAQACCGRVGSAGTGPEEEAAASGRPAGVHLVGTVSVCDPAPDERALLVPGDEEGPDTGFYLRFSPGFADLS
ncbi:hypothetical protein PJ985_02000 [Streptomyces sp. ACA25]|uniref:hypothetical protein n=1 Tax=Streptomyces sp. ACA25 TaxID=3022596 RepID=UPI0023083245|nr:hypothetical protein [Streptomyces sp. ACA25]MDB1086346.1 hypothetical protein [Streptomyces sp. ACA25]